MAWRNAVPALAHKGRAQTPVDVDGVVAATFGLENGGRLPAPVPLREAVGLLVDACAKPTFLYFK